MFKIMRAVGAKTPLLLALLAGFCPANAMACACGCGIFDTGVTSITPQDSASGLSVFVRFSPMDQDRNHEAGMPPALTTMPINASRPIFTPWAPIT